MNNIVIFGPTQVGKSSLAGYMASYYYPDDLFQKQVRLLKKQVNEIGVSFCNEMILPSFVSIDRDEIRKSTSQNSIGTTKRVHRVRITIPKIGDDNSDNTNFVFIDTPGTHARIAEKYRGIFEGDIGIFMINILDVLKMENACEIGTDGWCMDKERTKYLEPLQFWQAYKINSSFLLIVLSKIDHVDFDPERINEAIKKVCDLTKYVFPTRIVPVIPVAIAIAEQNNRFQRIGYNVVDENLPGYKTLVSYLKEINKLYSGETAHGFAYIDRLTITDNKDRSAPHYNAFRVKVLEGSIKIKDVITIGPVLYENIPRFINASVVSLKREQYSLTNALVQGQIGGIIIHKNIMIEGEKKEEKIDYEKLKILKTTVISTATIPMEVGDCIAVIINKDETSSVEWQTICNLGPKEQISIFWMGRKITIDLVGKIIRDNEAILTLLPLTNTVEQSLYSFAITPRNSKSPKDRLDVALVIQGTSYRYVAEKNTIVRIIERYYIHAQIYKLIDMKGRRMTTRIQMDSDDILGELSSVYKGVHKVSSKMSISENPSENYNDNENEAFTTVEYANKDRNQIAHYLKYVRFLMRDYEVRTVSMTTEIYTE